jgi:hypothetical protein
MLKGRFLSHLLQCWYSLPILLLVLRGSILPINERKIKLPKKLLKNKFGNIAFKPNIIWVKFYNYDFYLKHNVLQ